MAGGCEPGENQAGTVSRLRAGCAHRNLFPGFNIGPETAPQGVAVSFVVRNDQRCHWAAATQRRPVPRAPGRGIGAQGVECHRRRRPAKNRGPSALHEQVRVVAQGLHTRGVNQQCCRIGVLRIERIEILEKAGSRAVEVEGIGNTIKTFLHRGRRGWIQPSVLPLIVISRRGRCGEQADKKFVRRTVEIRPGPGEGEKRIVVDPIVNPPGGYTLHGTAPPPYRQPRRMN